VGAFFLTKYPERELFELPGALLMEDLRAAHEAYYGSSEDEYVYVADNDSVEIIEDAPPMPAVAQGTPARARAAAAPALPASRTPAAASRAPAAAAHASPASPAAASRASPAAASRASHAAAAPAALAFRALPSPPRVGAFRIPEPETVETVGFLEGDHAEGSFYHAKLCARDMPRLTEEDIAMLELVNNKAAVMRAMEEAGVILPLQGKLAMLARGGPHLGTELVQKLVCTGCMAFLPDGAYLKPDTGRHFHIFCWSGYGEAKNPKCMQIMAYYVKKYMMKNFDDLYEQSKRANSADRSAGRQ